MRSAVLICCLHSDITINRTLEYPIITIYRQTLYLVDTLKSQQALRICSFTHVLVEKIVFSMVQGQTHFNDDT